MRKDIEMEKYIVHFRPTYDDGEWDIESFETEKEMTAFIAGMEAAVGWTSIIFRKGDDGEEEYVS